MPRMRILVLVLLCLLSTQMQAGDDSTFLEALNFSIGGRLKLSSTWSDAVTAGSPDTRSSDITFVPGSIALDGVDTQSRHTVDLRTSRLWTTWHYPHGEHDLSAYVEVDFLETRNSTRGRSLSGIPRLRHYFFSYRGLSLGQTNTNFFNVSSFPEIVDNNGPLAVLIARQRQLAYRHEFSWGDVTASLEDSETRLSTATGERLQSNDERYPDFVATLSRQGDWGNLSLSGLLRELIHKDSVQDLRSDRSWGGGVSFAGRLQLPGSDNLRFSLVWGRGLGRYVSYGIFSDAVMDSAGELQPVELGGANLALQHWWTRKLRSNLALGVAHADYSTAIDAASENRWFFSSHLNLLWSPWRNTSVGLEWLYAYREREDGVNGELNRLQLSVIYKFH